MVWYGMGLMFYFLYLRVSSEAFYSNVNNSMFQAFRQHKQVHVFDDPGTSDLTFDVNFGHIARGLGRAGSMY